MDFAEMAGLEEGVVARARERCKGLFDPSQKNEPISHERRTEGERLEGDELEVDEYGREMLNGIHKDSFLQEIVPQASWLTQNKLNLQAEDREKKKKKKTGGIK